MRTILILAVATLALLAGCGTEPASSEPSPVEVAPPPPAAEDGSYPQEAIDDFLGGCAEQAGEELCVCAIDTLQTEIDYAEFAAMRDEMEATGMLPPALLAVVVEKCV